VFRESIHAGLARLSSCGCSVAAAGIVTINSL
jgi:hypothetical protein